MFTAKIVSQKKEKNGRRWRVTTERGKTYTVYWNGNPPRVLPIIAKLETKTSKTGNRYMVAEVVEGFQGIDDEALDEIQEVAGPTTSQPSQDDTYKTLVESIKQVFMDVMEKDLIGVGFMNPKERRYYFSLLDIEDPFEIALFVAKSLEAVLDNKQAFLDAVEAINSYVRYFTMKGGEKENAEGN